MRNVRKNHGGRWFREGGGDFLREKGEKVGGKNFLGGVKKKISGGFW